MDAQSWVLVGLGSNQGESQHILDDAATHLRGYARVGGNSGPEVSAAAQALFRCSSVWQTSPVDCPPDSPPFLNAAVAFVPEPTLTPERLLTELKALEREHGRGERYRKNTPRPLDLDLLLFGNERRQLPWFQLPHPRAVMRRFVLAPAAEVVPDCVWPGATQTIAQLLANLVSDEVVCPVGPLTVQIPK